MDTKKINALVELGKLPPDAREFLKYIMQGSNNIINLGDNTKIHIGPNIQYGSAPNKHQSGSSSNSDATKLPEVSSGGRSYAPPSSSSKEQPAPKVGGTVARRPAAPVETEGAAEDNAPVQPVPFVTDSADSSVLEILSNEDEE